MKNIKDQEHIEISPQRAMMIQSICKHLTTYGGSALIGDYGYWGGKGDTFRVSIDVGGLMFKCCLFRRFEKMK